MIEPQTPEEIAAAWLVLQERVPAARAVEFADLLLSFEANQANGQGGLSFNANQGHPQEWAVRSETIQRVKPLAFNGKRA